MQAEVNGSIHAAWTSENSWDFCCLLYLFTTVQVLNFNNWEKAPKNTKMALKSRHIKVFTVGLSLFVLTVTSLLLNYTHNYIDSLKPETYFFKFSDQIKRLVNYPTRPCSCATCVSEPKRSPWFDERFNESVPLLLLKENSVIPEDIYKWWLTLQREGNPKALNETMKELFETLSSRYDFMDSAPSRCRRCAVVGNSGNLKNSQYGELIDAHDIIMRMNHAPTIGFEADVGGRTTHHFIYPESAGQMHENATLILIPFKTLDLQWIVSALTTGTINFTYTRVPSKIKASRDKILVYNPAFMKYVLDTWMEKHGRYPSTGILCIIFSLHVCDQVDVYGFGANSQGNWHHYWENMTGNSAFRKTGVHDADFQANITEILTSINKIQIFKGR